VRTSSSVERDEKRRASEIKETERRHAERDAARKKQIVETNASWRSARDVGAYVGR
jgi:hypothetical protein